MGGGVGEGLGGQGAQHRDNGGCPSSSHSGACSFVSPSWYLASQAPTPSLTRGVFFKDRLQLVEEGIGTKMREICNTLNNNNKGRPQLVGEKLDIKLLCMVSKLFRRLGEKPNWCLTVGGRVIKFIL